MSITHRKKDKNQPSQRRRSSKDMYGNSWFVRRDHLNWCLQMVLHFGQTMFFLVKLINLIIFPILLWVKIIKLSLFTIQLRAMNNNTSLRHSELTAMTYLAFMMMIWFLESKRQEIWLLIVNVRYSKFKLNFWWMIKRGIRSYWVIYMFQSQNRF